MATDNPTQAAQPAYQISPPSQFNFSRPAEWPKWIRRFERFRSASGLSEKDELAQVNTLLYTMGDESDDILLSFSLNAEQQESYETVKQCFEDHFIVRRNTIFERAKFNQRKQGISESVDSFVTDLYCLVEHCEYGALKDEMIRDRIVVGLADEKLSEALQLDSALTLAKAINKARQSEAVKTQQSVVRGVDLPPEGELNVDVINKTKKRIATTAKESPSSNQNVNKPSYNQKSGHKTTVMFTSCQKCGKGPHASHNCPARTATCNKCKKKGHYAKVCRSAPAVASIDTEENENLFLGVIKQENTSKDWNVLVNLEGKTLEFKPDTGADVSVVSASVLNSFPNVTLQTSETRLRGPDNKELIIVGKFKTVLRVGERTTSQFVYVIDQLQKPLLGRPAIEALGILARIGTTSILHPEDEFPELFEGLGKLSSEYAYTIQLKEGAKPHALTCPRRVPIPLMEKVRQELQRMVALGVISPVEHPTDWCSGMVVVPKPDGTVRICVDLTRLNQNVKRERYILPAVEYTLGLLAGARWFSKLDANCGFWQIELSPESSLLTTFITPFGRFQFNRLPFGISSAPEVYQRTMNKILQGLPGVTAQLDDTLVYEGATIEEHDCRLREVLQRVKSSGMTLNKKKCQFRKTEVTFLGQRVSTHGVQPCDEKVQAILHIAVPTDIPELRRFLGMANYLGKFVPHLAERTIPLTELLRAKNAWEWGPAQQKAFEDVKLGISSAPVLVLYDCKLPTRISVDASCYGLGGILEQMQPNQNWQPVAYASKMLTETQQRYSQIEKEGLAVVWGCEKFRDYLLGLEFTIVTDHKPLLPLFMSKPLTELTPRLQRFRMKLMQYSYTMVHVPGKDLIVADTLSRAPSPVEKGSEDRWETEVEAYVAAVMTSLPATPQRLNTIQTQQDADPVCSGLKRITQEGWPQKSRVSKDLLPYWEFRGDLTVEKDLLLKGQQLVIPESLQPEILEKIHESHQGIVKTKRLAATSVWWLGMGKAISNMVSRCRTCLRTKQNSFEPLIPSTLPERPWAKVAMDLFELRGRHYILVVDYYSRFPETRLLTSTTSAAVINHLKSIFSIHGIPEIVVSDNGPQFYCREFREFADNYGFCHITSSPKFPQSNGLAESSVKTVKNLLEKCVDPYRSLLAYRTTPLEHGYSPSQLLMGRLLRTTVPGSEKTLQPTLVDPVGFRKKDQAIKLRQKTDFDKRHRARELTTLAPGEKVWIPQTQQQGSVVQQAPTPRSYYVDTPRGILRRNRRDLISEASPPDIVCASPERSACVNKNVDVPNYQQSTPTQAYRTRFGRLSVPPQRLTYE